MEHTPLSSASIQGSEDLYPLPQKINAYRDDCQFFLIFEDRNYAHLLWSKNVDVGDVPYHYPPNLEAEGKPGVIEVLNMSKLCRLQQSYRWQPHLPFMPVALESHPWAERYHYKYDTLPIIKDGPTSWSLNHSVSQRWWNHVNIFSYILGHWRHHLAQAPMSVDYLQDIRQIDLNRSFPTEKQARGYFWFYRTMIFSMFAEFSFATAAKPKWRDSIKSLLAKQKQDVTEGWLDDVEDALCDFRFTKRAGVIIDAGNTQLWPFLRRYHENGVPTLMDVGHVLFHDREYHEDPKKPKEPTIVVNNPTGMDRYYKYPQDWPSKADIIAGTEKHLREYYNLRLKPSSQPTYVPLDLSRPPVEEIGGGVHQRPPTSPWINPDTQEPVELIQVAEPIPADTQWPPDEMSWIEFFARRREVNRKIEERETPVEKTRRETRLKDSLRINQKYSSGPSKNSAVYRWEQFGEIDLHATIDQVKIPFWRKVKVDRMVVDSVWDKFVPTQRLYDSFHNEWHLMILFDVYAEAPDHDYCDDDDIDMQDSPIIDQNQPVAYLDDINFAPPANAYSTVQVLSSQIGFVAPTNLKSWAYLTLGLQCSCPRRPPLLYPNTRHVMSFFIDRADETLAEYQDLQEFVSYIVERQFNNPRLIDLSDLHPQHVNTLNVKAAGIAITKVNILQSVFGKANATVERTGYILTPKHQYSSFNHGWILVVFEATTVLQIIRNSWGSSSMETLVRHLVRHGVEFRTLVPAFNIIPAHILHVGQALIDYTPHPPMTKPRHDRADYDDYVKRRKEILRSPHAKAAYRTGGIIWRLAMDSQANFDDIIDDILDGPSEIGPTRGEYFYLNGMRYYDDVVSPVVANLISGMYGVDGRSYWPTDEAWRKRRWGYKTSVRGYLMWNHKDEEFYRNRVKECLAADNFGQPRSKALWKRYGSTKHKFDNPFEEYCESFLDSSLG